MLLSLLRSALQVLTMHVSRLRREYIALAIVGIVVLFPFWFLFLRAPAMFPVGETIPIPNGTSATRAAYILEQAHALDTPFLFRVLVRLTPGVHGVQAGMYQFTRPTGVLTLAWNLTHGISGLPTVRVTFPEGTTVRQMGDKLAVLLPGFKGEQFKSEAIPSEGYLFPDTYFFLPNASISDVITTMKGDFATHSSWKKASTLVGVSERDEVIMASLLEGEGKSLEDRRMIAGILWKRIAIGMPLQVDATFGYDYGKTGYVPTSADLRNNSAYNSYRYKGLPPTPINNPGEASLLAAVTPTTSDYLYYLTGSDGIMHYAKTFAEHIANQKKYFK